MNTKAIETRTYHGTAKNQGDRAHMNGTATGNNVRNREQQNRPDNEDLLRGIHEVYEDLKSFLPNMSHDDLMKLAEQKTPEHLPIALKKLGVIVA